MSQTELREVISRLPARFQIIATRQQFSERIINILYRAAQLETSTSESLDEIEAQISVEMQPRTFSDFSEALPPIERQSQRTSERSHPASLNTLTLLAVFLFICGKLSTTRYYVAGLLKDRFEHFRRLLFVELMQLDMPAFTAEGESVGVQEGETQAFLTWIFAVAIYSWSTENADFALEGVELMTCLKDLVLKLEDYADLERLLRGYLYSEPLLSSMETCWNMISYDKSEGSSSNV